MSEENTGSKNAPRPPFTEAEIRDFVQWLRGRSDYVAEYDWFHAEEDVILAAQMIEQLLHEREVGA